MNCSSKILVSILSLALCGHLFSQVVEIRGIGDSKTVDAAGKSLPEGEAAKQAVRNAAVNGIDKILELQSDNLRQQFKERVSGVVDRVDRVRLILKDCKITTEPIQEQKTVRATVKASMDVNELKDLMNQWDKKNEQVVRSDLQVALFFTVRRTKSIQVTKGVAVKEETDSNVESSGGEKIAEEGVHTSESSKESTSRDGTVTTTESAETALYESDAQMTESFGTGLSGQFTDKGFKGIVDSANFESSELLCEDITKHGKAMPATMRKLAKEIKELAASEAEYSKLDLVIVGSLDFSKPTPDPISGLTKVQATMSGKVFKLKGAAGILELKAALEPKNLSGVGDSEENAKKRAVEGMAPLAADEIISKLKNNGVL